MQQSKGSVFLKVSGILLIIGGVYTILFAGIRGIIGYSAGTVIANSGELTAGRVVGTLTLVGAIVSLIGGILELITGIVGVKNNNKPEKATTCLVWGIIVLVINAAVLIMALAGGISGVVTIIATILGSLVLPVLYIIGAVKNKQSV